MNSLFVLLRYVSRPELSSRPIRSVLMIGTVTVGVALLTAMHIATSSIVSGFAGDLERLAGKADLQVTFGTGETGFSEDLLDKIRTLPFVAQAAALVHSQVTFEDGEPETVELFGIDLMQEDVLQLYDVEVLEREKGDFSILDDPRGIFVTDTLARARNLKLGSHVRLSAVDGEHDYTVHGIVATKGLAGYLGGKLIAMFLPASQPVAGKPSDIATSMIDQIDVRLRPGTDARMAQNAIAALLPPGFHANPPIQRRLLGEHTVDGLRATLVGMSTLALLASVFIIYASTTTMVFQRLAAMATLASIGASPATLVRAVTIEAAVLGTIGSFAGVVLGIGLASFIGGDAAAGMGLNYSLPFTADRFSWDPRVVFGIHPLVGIAASACSAYLPARRLRSVTPLVLHWNSSPARHSSAFPVGRTMALAIIPAVIGFLALTYGVSRASAEWVSAGGIIVIGASVLAMLPALRSSWTAARPFLAKLSGIAGRIAGENLVRTLDRSLVTASAITLSVAIAVGAGSLVQSFRSSVSDWYGFAGDALISARAVTGGWLPAPIPRSLEEPIRQSISVADVQTLRVVQGQQYRGERIAVAGLSPALLWDAVEEGTLIGVARSEAEARLARGEAAAVSENFVSHFGLPQDHELRLAAPTGGELKIPVVAVVPDYISDKGSVLLLRDVVRTRWNDDLVNFYAVRLSPGASLSDLRQDVHRNLGSADSLSVMATSEMVDRVDGFISEAFADIDTIKLLVLFLTAIGIADLVVSNVISRRRELAVLRLVGLTNSQLVQTARLEGLCVTIGATICGAVVGVVCAWLWVHYNYPALVGYVLRLNIGWSSIGASLLMAVITAFAAATLAARYALRQPALTTIRFE